MDDYNYPPPHEHHLTSSRLASTSPVPSYNTSSSSSSVSLTTRLTHHLIIDHRVFKVLVIQSLTVLEAEIILAVLLLDSLRSVLALDCGGRGGGSGLAVGLSSSGGGFERRVLVSLPGGGDEGAGERVGEMG